MIKHTESRLKKAAPGLLKTAAAEPRGREFNQHVQEVVFWTDGLENRRPARIYISIVAVFYM